VSRLHTLSEQTIRKLQADHQRLQNQLVDLQARVVHANREALREDVYIAKTTTSISAITTTNSTAVAGSGTAEIYALHVSDANSVKPRRVSPPMTVTAYSMLSDSVSADQWVVLRRDYESGEWILDAEGDAVIIGVSVCIVHFTLTAPLTLGGTATATVTSCPTGGVAVGETITVEDPFGGPGIWRTESTLAAGVEGIAYKPCGDATCNYYILHLEMQARVICARLSSPLPDGAPILLDHMFGYQPTEITINSCINVHGHLAKDDEVVAFYHERDHEYRVIESTMPTTGSTNIAPANLTLCVSCTWSGSEIAAGACASTLTTKLTANLDTWLTMRESTVLGEVYLEIKAPSTHGRMVMTHQDSDSGLPRWRNSVEANKLQAADLVLDTDRTLAGVTNPLVVQASGGTSAGNVFLQLPGGPLTSPAGLHSQLCVVGTTNSGRCVELGYTDATWSGSVILYGLNDLCAPGSSDHLLKHTLTFDKGALTGWSIQKRCDVTITSSVDAGIETGQSGSPDANTGPSCSLITTTTPDPCT